MDRSPHVLRVSALTTVLAGLLAFTAPFTARLAGTEAGGGIETPVITGSPATRAVTGRGGLRPATTPRFAAATPRVAATTATSPGVAEPLERGAKPRTHLLVDVPASGLAARRNPWVGSPIVGRVVGASRFYRVPTVAWVEEISGNGRWGRVELPYVWPRRDGWIPLDGLSRSSSAVTVKADLSARRLTVWKHGQVVFRAPAAIGRSTSPTPPGEYFVTDRVPFAPGGYLGSFAFGISGIQPRLPAGWSGGDQLAIHGTNSPSSIGTAASAGCLRVSEQTLAGLKPMLKLGTPVVIVP